MAAGFLRLWKVAAMGTVAVGASLMGEMVASAQQAPRADVMIIQATKCDQKSIDPAIGTPPPGLGYDCLKLLGHPPPLQLPLNTPATTTLPNGRTFQLVYTGKTDPKYNVTASISNADSSPGFTKLADIHADPNVPFNVGGITYQGGVLVLTVRILP